MEVHTLGGVHNYFAYDGGFQRIEKQDAAGTAKYNWDGLNVLLERDGGDTTTTTHTHGPVAIPGIGTHLTTRRHGGTPADIWYEHDAIGSTRQLTDESAPPEITRRNLLDAWGNMLASAGTQDTPYVFTGKETDPDTGLIYFGRRFYDPTIARWINRDPAKDGLNWYQYAGNNPVGMVDPEGLQGYFDDLNLSVWSRGDAPGKQSAKRRKANAERLRNWPLKAYASGAWEGLNMGFWRFSDWVNNDTYGLTQGWYSLSDPEIQTIDALLDFGDWSMKAAGALYVLSAGWGELRGEIQGRLNVSRPFVRATRWYDPNTTGRSVLGPVEVPTKTGKSKIVGNWVVIGRKSPWTYVRAGGGGEYTPFGRLGWPKEYSYETSATFYVPRWTLGLPTGNPLDRWIKGPLHGQRQYWGDPFDIRTDPDFWLREIGMGF